mgnify:CR=1 FL=1
MEQVSNKYFVKATKIVEQKGGKMLSPDSDYNNAYSKLKIKCQDNHEFYITLSNLNLDRWCPQCSTRKMERYTKQVAINFLNRKLT